MKSKTGLLPVFFNNLKNKIMKTLKVNFEINLQKAIIITFIIAVISVTIFNIATVGFAKP